MSELDDTVLRVARALPAWQREQLADALRGCTDAAEAARRSVTRLAPAPAFGAHVDELLDAWREAAEPRPTGAGVALALDAAGRAIADAAGRTVTPVWTGPAAGVPVRLTGAVLRQVIGEAHDRLLVLSFAAYKIPEVMAALEAAIAGGVRVDLVLETAEDSAGKLAFDQLPDFLGLDGVTIWHWPAVARPVPGASLHAKAIVADRAVALVTSANLTGHALAHNIELGLLIHDESVAGRIDEHVRGLMQREVLRRVVA